MRRVSALLAVAAAALVAAGASSAATSVVNGGFDTGDLTGWTTFVTGNGAIDPNGVASFDTTGGGASNAAFFSVGEVVFTGAEEGGGISQTVTVAAGVYAFTADIAVHVDLDESNFDCGTFSLLVDGVAVATHAFGGAPTTCIGGNTYRSSLAAAVPLTAGSHQLRVLITRHFRQPPGLTQYVDNVALAPAGALLPPQENSTFLCYSKFEQDSGKVFDVKQYADRIADGYWKPFAVAGPAPSSSFTTAGAYYLACNPPATLKPTGFGVDLSGFDRYPLPLYAFAPTVFAVVG
jgi:hypothetical protein